VLQLRRARMFGFRCDVQVLFRPARRQLYTDTWLDRVLRSDRRGAALAKLLSAEAERWVPEHFYAEVLAVRRRQFLIERKLTESQATAAVNRFGGLHLHQLPCLARPPLPGATATTGPQPTFSTSRWQINSVGVRSPMINASPAPTRRRHSSAASASPSKAETSVGAATTDQIDQLRGFCCSRRRGVWLRRARRPLRAGGVPAVPYRACVPTSTETPIERGSVSRCDGRGVNGRAGSGSRASPGGRPGASLPRVRGSLDQADRRPSRSLSGDRQGVLLRPDRGEGAGGQGPLRRRVPRLRRVHAAAERQGGRLRVLQMRREAPCCIPGAAGRNSKEGSWV
jgi:hypothetical protein